MNIARAILEDLKNQGVKHIFGIPAGTVSALYDELCDIDIQTIITKNEAGAAYSAGKYAATSGKLGVCIFAGGVGINNAVNGIADAMRMQAPMLIISGHVQKWQTGKGAIQELNTEDIFKPITKYSKTIFEENEVLSCLNHAIKLALIPPMGPVHISIPVDLQVLPAEDVLDEAAISSVMESDISVGKSIEAAIKVINEEANGIIFTGRGCKGMSKEIMELSEHLSWPIVTTPQGKANVPADFSLYLGNYGFASTYAAEEYVEADNATCLLVLGSSLGESSTKNYSQALVHGKKIIHIDWSPEVLGRVYKTDVSICADLHNVLPQLLKKTDKKSGNFVRPEELNLPYVKNHTGLSLRLFFEKIPSLLPEKTHYISDIGEFMNHVFKFMPIPAGSDFSISLNYGAMGSGIGSALGVQLASPDKRAAVFVGDGSFFMNGMEVLTAKEYKLPIIYFVINNSMLGYVEHGQRYVYKRALKEYKQLRISICSMMNAAGIRSIQIENLEELNRIPDFINYSDGPCVIELITDGSEPIPVADRFKELEKKL